ncbi:MAG: hypothetical protein PHG48_02085 [Eubacteriales bacterium]|nr:hypothetical protein [Eubacteriales bacterium]
MKISFVFGGGINFLPWGVNMKGFFAFIGILVLIVAVIAGGLYAAVSLPKKVDVTWTEQDLASYMQKARADIGTSGSTGASMEDLLFGNFKSTGAVAVNEVITSQEATAMANSVMRGQNLIEDPRLGFRADGTMEASGYIGTGVSGLAEIFPEIKPYEEFLKYAEGKPIYWRYSLTRVNNKKFDAHTEELRIGQIPIPLTQAGAGLVQAGTALNNMIARIDGFSCEALTIDEDGFHFKGTIPDKLEYIDKDNVLGKAAP